MLRIMTLFAKLFGERIEWNGYAAKFPTDPQ